MILLTSLENPRNRVLMWSLVLTDPEVTTHSPPPSCDPPYENYVSYDGACYRPKATAKTWKVRS